MPCSGSRTCLCFAVAYDATYDEVWVVHDRAEGSTKGIPEFTALVDSSRCLGVDVAEGTSVSRRKRREEM
jgi:hypothetical protein